MSLWITILYIFMEIISLQPSLHIYLIFVRCSVEKIFISIYRPIHSLDDYFIQNCYNSIDMIPVVAGEYKLVLVGDSAVGKSSLLSQFVDGKFDQHLLSTIGVDFKFRRVKVGADQVKLQIWDTAGQETFRSIVSAYYNSADAILLCYDLSNYETFESLKEYWLPQAQNNNKTSAKIFLIGNKLDAKREVESYSLDSLRDAGIHAFYEVSAKENLNVEKSFTQIAKILHTAKPNKGQKQGTGESSKLNKGIAGSRPKNMTAEDLQGLTPQKKSCCK